MNNEDASLDHQLLALLQAVRDTHDDSARFTLNQLLRSDPAARAAMARLLVDEQVLINRLRDDSIVSLLDAASFAGPVNVVRSPRWISWRPLTAAAAGIAFGMLCTSVVFGFVTPPMDLIKKVPLTVYSPGLETIETIIGDGLPDHAGHWGADTDGKSAMVVTAENGVQPLEGKHMLRMEPIPPDKDGKNHLSRVYQVLDLRSQPLQGTAEDAEVQITASFFAEKGDVASRYLIRAFALKETPEQATKGFWPKTEEEGVVSVKRTFDVLRGSHEWHTFSLKMPLPRDAKTLVFILGAGRVSDALETSQVHYLDGVQVSVLTPEPTLP
ncbi:MAG: hypothetical protein RL693_971 [Verrucomicrobiota bacterium]|jgi:hypothetical protein